MNQSFIRMFIGKTSSEKEIWMCMEEDRIDEWVRTQMSDFSIRDLVDAYCAFRFLSTQKIKHDFDLVLLSARHADGVMSSDIKKISNLIKELGLTSSESIHKHGSNYVTIKPSEF